MEYSKILTAQEHKLIGSTVDEKYKQQPYKPLCIVDEASIEKCNKERLEIKLLGAVCVSYWGTKGNFGTATLEPLDTNAGSETYGQTIRDPVLIEIIVDTGFNEDLRDKFPFKRGEPKVRL
jgi:hypothetical protein